MKILKVQAGGPIKCYEDQKNDVKPFQDYLTRWWCTYCMLKRLRWLKHAILALYGAQEIDCDVLLVVQWRILHQIKIAIAVMAGF